MAQFQSTPSARRATSSALHFADRRAISIHALREEGDGALQKPHTQTADFNPRPPRGGRRRDGVIRARRKLFQSTPSARRATWKEICDRIRKDISIHALREEGDPINGCSSHSP